MSGEAEGGQLLTCWEGVASHGAVSQLIALYLKTWVDRTMAFVFALQGVVLLFCQ